MPQIITLTTDFGHKGPFVAVMKGVMLQRSPEARIIDLTHEIHVHWPAEAGFWLSRAYGFFPAGTVHVAVVDPGVGTARDIIASEYDGHVFLAPDNGLLPVVFASADGVSHYRLSGDWQAAQDWPESSSTFHGRDIFAPLAADIASGRIKPGDIGPPVTELVPSLLDDPELKNGTVRGTVIAIDHFGNLITNIDEKLISGFRKPRVKAGGHELALHETYGNCAPGELLALINSFHVVEIARAEGSAADGLGLGRGAPILIVDE
jgi:S-adenosylmethionine hydrolase